MKEFSGAYDYLEFDGSTNLVENGEKVYVYNSGCDVLKFSTEDIIIDYICYTVDNMMPYPKTIPDRNVFFSAFQFEFTENTIIQGLRPSIVEEGTLLKTVNNNLDHHDYHVLRCGVGCFTKMKIEFFHAFYE